MKTTLLTFLMLILCAVVPAQTKMTDREFEGLKGEVKSVRTEYANVEKSQGAPPNRERKLDGENFYDKKGNLTQTLYPGTNRKLIYTLIDGFKTYKQSDIEKKPKPSDGVMLIMKGDGEPIEEPEKLFPPDERYDTKYVYEYDPKGRIAVERVFGNNGKLWSKRSFVYDDKGRVIEENLNDTGEITKFTFKYDDKGNLIERLDERTIKGREKNKDFKMVYSDYKLDSKGNWIERRQTWHLYTQGQPAIVETVFYRTIVYF